MHIAFDERFQTSNYRATGATSSKQSVQIRNWRQAKMNAKDNKLVLIVDDDQSVRAGLTDLLQSMDIPVQTFGTAAELLESDLPDVAACLVLDIRLPGINGLEFQDTLVRKDIRIPIVFMTGHGDIPMSVKAMKAGAIDFLVKPFREQDMLDAVARALERDSKRREGERSVSEFRKRFELLTPREREVLSLATSGLMNKQIAHQLQIQEITVKVHRGRVMEKMAAHSFADLVKMAEAIGVGRAT
jgi:FixJ family two-component response regulator